MQQQQQQKRRSPSPMSLQPLFRQQHQQRQQQQHYSIPTLVIQPGNRTSGGSQQRPHYTSADSLVSNEFQPIDMSIDEYIIQNDRQGDGNTTHAVASVAATLESTSVVDDITYPVADASAINEEDTEEANNVDYGTQHDNDNAWSSRHSRNESARLAASNHSISQVDNMANVYPTSGSNAPSVVVLGNSSSLPLSATIHGSPIGQQRVILSSTHDNRQSLRQQADRNRPEIEINFEEDDISFLQGGGNDANIMSSACGWTEVMTSSTNSRVGTGRVHGVGGMIGAGLPAINHHSTTMPSPRSLHSAALLNGVMYIFGGYDGTQRVNSFHAYTFADKRWSPVLPSANSGNPPSPRDRHVSVAFANSFYVHGGFDGIARDASLFSFDFSTMAWREVIASQGRPPSARHSHAAVVHNHSMYIFGGYDGSYKSDLHEFDFTLSRWSSVPAVGRRPRPRYRATCVVYKDLMVLYGGHDGTKHLSDTFTFDFNTLTWNTLITDGVQPIPRDSHVAVVHGNSMYVFGGSSGVALNDFHELQLPSTNSASPVGGAATAVAGGSAMALSSSASNAASNTPSTTTARWRPIRTPQNENSHQPNRRFCHVAVTYNDSMYVFGGYDGADRLNSFIKFDFAMYDLSFDIPQSVLINDLRSFVNNEKLSDITFIVEDEPIFAHKLMLMRCSYFQALFSGHMRESDMDTIRIEQVRYPIFLGILEYLYTDQLSSMPFHAAMEYFEAADLFCIPRLKTMCEKRMLQHITIENASSIFHAADVHSASGLRQKTKKYMLTHFEEVSKTTAFEEMGRQNVDLVFELLHSR